MCFYFVLFSYGIYLRMIADILFRQPVTEQVFPLPSADRGNGCRASGTAVLAAGLEGGDKAG